jgi:F-type H+-transporting ATPase subunit delta
LSEPASISSGIAIRYATAVFELAKQEKKLKQLEKDVDELDDALTKSSELRSLVTSPLYTRSEVGQAIEALARSMKLQPAMVNTLALMATKRRLFVMPNWLAALRARIAEEKGKITAEVISAKALSKVQSVSLAETLKAQMSMDVELKATVDESLIGGLVVKVGSKMIDTSIRAKLNALQNKMKEVG